MSVDRSTTLATIIILIFCGCKSPIQNDIVLSNQEDSLARINAYSLRQLNQVQGLGLTILHTAVIANDVQVVEALINRKVNLDAKTSSLNSWFISLESSSFIGFAALIPPCAATE